MIESSFDQKTRCLKIQVKGRFDYNCHKSFKEAFSAVKDAQSYDVDLAQVDYLDSSALGMLLLLRDHAGGEKAVILLSHVNSNVLEILKIANFDRLFNING